MNALQNDIPKYRKKKHKSVKKSNHKHIWKEVLFHSRAPDFYGKIKDYYSRGLRCDICGRLEYNHIFETELDPLTGYHEMMSQEWTYQKYKDVLPLIEITHPWNGPVEVIADDRQD